VKAFRASHAGEVELGRNDLVEVFSVGDSGYWEGRCLRTGGEGWFRSECVEEVDDEERARLEMVAKRRQFMELIQSCDLSALRTVVLQRGRKGFGFVLRGAKSKLKLVFGPLTIREKIVDYGIRKLSLVLL